MSNDCCLLPESNPIQSNPTEPRRLLETRGGLIIRKLCVLLQPKTIYVALASVLQTNSDLAFIGVMVEVGVRSVSWSGYVFVMHRCHTSK